jgi:hypothetical protein
MVPLRLAPVARQSYAALRKYEWIKCIDGSALALIEIFHPRGLQALQERIYPRASKIIVSILLVSNAELPLGKLLFGQRRIEGTCVSPVEILLVLPVVGTLAASLLWPTAHSSRGLGQDFGDKRTVLRRNNAELMLRGDLRQQKVSRRRRVASLLHK